MIVKLVTSTLAVLVAALICCCIRGDRATRVCRTRPTRLAATSREFARSPTSTAVPMQSEPVLEPHDARHTPPIAHDESAVSRTLMKEYLFLSYSITLWRLWSGDEVHGQQIEIVHHGRRLHLLAGAPPGGNPRW